MRPFTAAPASRPGVVTEWVAGGMNAKDSDRRRHWEADGAKALLESVLARAGIPPAGRRVQIVSTFLRTSAIPPVSGVVADRHGARVRVKPAGYPSGFMAVVLCDPGETPDGLAALLARTVDGLGDANAAAATPVPPTDPAVTRRAAEIAGELATAPCGSLGEFAGLVAAEVGPGEDPAYWMKALSAAEAAGALARNGVRFLAVPPPGPEPEAATPPAPAAGPGPAVPAPAVDMSAVESLAAGAGGMIAALSRIQSLHEARKKIIARLEEAKADLETNGVDIRKAAKALDLTTLTLAADALGG